MKFLSILFITLGAVSAQAEIIFNPSVSYIKQEDENAGATSELEMSSYDLKLGYVHPSGLVLGGMYSMMKFGDDKGFAAGPTLGYSHYSGFYALFTYFLMAEHDFGSGTTLTDGMGPQIDVGWVFPVTRAFMIGPQITYRSISYDKVETSGGSATIDYSRSNILPSISLWFRF